MVETMKNGVYFITGIDTGIGKTVATGFLAQCLLARGVKVITQKLVQTGNVGDSEDIAEHRRIMGVGTLAEDRQHTTAPQIFSYPASPHLAAELDGRRLDIDAITAATTHLAQRYDVVLLEGAGGLMVPLTRGLLTIEYVAARHYPAILVTSSRLGSINHTLLSFLALQRYALGLYALVFNAIHDTASAPIAASTRELFRRILATDFPRARWIDLPVLE